MNQKLSTEILRALHTSGATRITLDELCVLVGVTDDVAREGVRARKPRREDVRATVRELDRLGYVDALRMRLTLQGFAVAVSALPAARPALHLVA
jgi:hypothetical protein